MLQGVPSADGACLIHQVEAHDTLASLAVRYGTTVSRIKQLNGLQRDKLVGYEQLRVPLAASTSAVAPQQDLAQRRSRVDGSLDADGPVEKPTGSDLRRKSDSSASSRVLWFAVWFAVWFAHCAGTTHPLLHRTVLLVEVSERRKREKEGMALFLVPVVFLAFGVCITILVVNSQLAKSVPSG